VPVAVPEAATRADGNGLSDLPMPLAQTLEAMRNQLELLARTVQLLEKRIGMTEQQVLDARNELRSEKQRGPPGSC
jgi:hypothetical protein